MLADGSELPADLHVIYATGYGSMNGWAADLIGRDVADRVGKVWGLGSDTKKDPGPWEGEGQTQHVEAARSSRGSGSTGGNLHQSPATIPSS